MGKAERRTRREEYSEATREALVAAGRHAFHKEGFQAANVEAISRAARLTRGAFYHHFADKRALFDVVVVALQTEAAAKVKAQALTKRRVWDRLYAGIDAYLDACMDGAYARIVVQEAPSVLGQERFREIEEAYPMALLAATFEALKARGELDFEDTRLLTSMVDAMICKVSLMLIEADEPEALRKRSIGLVQLLLESIRVRAHTSGLEV